MVVPFPTNPLMRSAGENLAYISGHKRSRQKKRLLARRASQSPTIGSRPASNRATWIAPALPFHTSRGRGRRGGGGGEDLRNQELCWREEDGLGGDLAAVVAFREELAERHLEDDRFPAPYDTRCAFRSEAGEGRRNRHSSSAERCGWSGFEAGFWGVRAGA